MQKSYQVAEVENKGDILRINLKGETKGYSLKATKKNIAKIKPGRTVNVKNGRIVV